MIYKHLDKFKTKRMAIKGMLVNSKVYIFLSENLNQTKRYFKICFKKEILLFLKDAPKKNTKFK